MSLEVVKVLIYSRRRNCPLVKKKKKKKKKIKKDK